MNWVTKAWNYLTKVEPEPEVEVPRHIWIEINKLMPVEYLGKLVEVPVLDVEFDWETNVIGRLVSLSYESATNKTTLQLHAPHFTTDVEVYPNMLVKVHL